MKYEIHANSCRVCLTQSKKLRSLYKPIDEGDEPPNKMLYLITGVQVEKIDEHATLPKNICKNCELSLNMAYEFRANALKTQQIVKDYLKCLERNDRNEGEEDFVKHEYEEILDMEQLGEGECQITLDEDITEHNLETLTGDELMNNEEEDEHEEHSSYLIGEDEENEIDNYSDHHQENTDEDFDEYENSQTIEEQKAENIERLEETLENEDQDYTIEHAKDNTEVSKKKSAKLLRKSEMPVEERIYSNSRVSMKAIPRRGRKSTNATEKPGYICDICGNIYSKRGRMTEHRQRHYKELKYNCEVCNEKFYTRELLRKHMFSHSGGKPFKCEYCSRTFYYESVKKAHEAVHKGHKPHVCDVCGKAFGYAHALKKHELIHAEIKLYRCEYCNKDFRLQHHMKQHELTKLHQNAVRFANNGGAKVEDCISSGTNTNEMIEKYQNDDILFIEELAEDQLNSCS